MYEEYSKKESGGSSMLRLLRNISLLLLTVLIFMGTLIVLTWMFNILSPKHKKEAQERQAQQENLLNKFDVALLDAGYLRRSAGREYVYVPSLKILVENLTEYQVEKFFLEAVFWRKRRLLCRASAPVFYLEPGERREVFLKSLESVGFGTVYQGLNLMQTSDDLDYDVWVQMDRIRAKTFSGILKFKLLDSF